MPASPKHLEWPSLLLIALCYALWGWATTALAGVSLLLAIPLAGLAISFHSSLTHEIIHGHPTPWARVNEALIFPALALTVPYLRFRDTHLAHHHDEFLTDPYDDPESNYWDPAVWSRLGPVPRLALRVNNTLLGRMLIGPVLGTIGFICLERRAARAGDKRVLRGWLWHLPALIPVGLWLVYVAEMPVWAYLIAVYIGHALQKIRTYLEHRAHVLPRGRTVVVEDRGPLALLFLNNNLHAVHHAHPNRPWYELPGLYRQRRDHFLTRNDGYVYASYRDVFARFATRAKDPVPHPLWRRPGE